jgi:hypothetical protein
MSFLHPPLPVRMLKEVDQQFDSIARLLGGDASVKLLASVPVQAVGVG